jgi:hypothetical protein
MLGKPLISYWGIFILLIISSLSIPVLTMADEAISSIPQAGTQVGIFDGSIPSGDGIVSIKAVSGKLYQIPVMSPLGVIQALAGTDIIDTYKVGDELIVKMGLLTLDGINGYSNSGDYSWFVFVNEKKLQDYLLPKEEALNTFKLKTGDVILFAYGNPTRPAGEALRTLRISIGSKPETPNTIPPAGNVSSTPVVTPYPIIVPVITEKPVKISNISEDQVLEKNLKDPNMPVYIGQETKETVTTETTHIVTEKKPADPNQPVYEGSETKEAITPEPANTATEKKPADPNQPVYEGSETKETITPEPAHTAGEKKPADPNQPAYEGSETKEMVTAVPTLSPIEKGTESNEKDVKNDSSEKTEAENQTESDTKPVRSPSGQEVIYSGPISPPSGNVNITADSDIDYDISGKTPLGLLQALLSNGKIGTISVSDRGMKKGGILTLLSINSYSYGEEAWFVQINDLTLKDYFNPSTDGLNIRTLNKGDKVTYYYGKLDQAPATAKAAIYMTIE